MIIIDKMMAVSKRPYFIYNTFLPVNCVMPVCLLPKKPHQRCSGIFENDKLFLLKLRLNN